MARLDLSTRASRLQAELRGRDLSQPLPKYIERDLDRFARAAGYEPERFRRLKPSTQRRYISAAKQGRTVAQERQRVKEQRAARPQRTDRPFGTSLMSKRQRIYAARDKIVAMGLDTTATANTQMDALAVEVLLSDEGIEAHIGVYGEDYVLLHVENMVTALRDPRFGNQQWHVFKSSPVYPDEDERWFWYHSGGTLHYDTDIWAAYD